MFRLDRITEASRARRTRRASPRRAADGSVPGTCSSPIPSDPVAELDLQQDASWVADYYPIEASERLADGRLRITLRYSDQGWLRAAGAATRWCGERLGRTTAQYAEAVRARADSRVEPLFTR